MKIYISVLLIAIGMLACSTESESLEDKIKNRVAEFRGDVGVFVKHLTTGEEVAINADSLFPTASMIKVPITIGIFDKIEKGELNYDSTLTYRDSLLYAGEDILGSFKDGEKISLSKVLMLMITTSDNTASLWCQHLAGTGTAINAWLDDNGFANTRVNSRTEGRQKNWKQYGWGQTTPREMAELLMRIHEGNIISKRASERIYRNLTRIYWDGEALSQIPPYVQVASKQGAVNKSRSEVVLVNAPHGDYVVCVITKNQVDESWGADNEGFVLLRDISRIVWQHYKPASTWSPSPGIEAWH